MYLDCFETLTLCIYKDKHYIFNLLLKETVKYINLKPSDSLEKHKLLKNY